MLLLDDDLYVYVLYYYMKFGDYIGWYYDMLYYDGWCYMLLIGVIDELLCWFDYELYMCNLDVVDELGFV